MSFKALVGRGSRTALQALQGLRHRNVDYVFWADTPAEPCPSCGHVQCADFVRSSSVGLGSSQAMADSGTTARQFSGADRNKV